MDARNPAYIRIFTRLAFQCCALGTSRFGRRLCEATPRSDFNISSRVQALIDGVHTALRARRSNGTPPAHTVDAIGLVQSYHELRVRHTDTNTSPRGRAVHCSTRESRIKYLPSTFLPRYIIISYSTQSHNLPAHSSQLISCTSNLQPKQIIHPYHHFHHAQQKPPCFRTPRPRRSRGTCETRRCRGTGTVNCHWYRKTRRLARRKMRRPHQCS